MVGWYVSRLVFLASVKCSIESGTEKYSGKTMKAGFCLAASRMPSAAASKFASKVLRILRWITLTFNVDLLPCVRFVIDGVFRLLKLTAFKQNSLGMGWMEIMFSVYTCYATDVYCLMIFLEGFK